ncbi:DNA-binding transcriptional regulator, MurR/RpiR family, contains HTH and SIS domains [Tindallia magadiensis]|uniref:DNA-binding transcriptional regulator, MurR/RpiR family, contains HTH and SIS domains n=1 Tax=Tindallia magadiensis TaxID=69895 RepID=A0A1I3AG98_9FIRM|nr:MurR/RpiR family transcriptional regulator [Tindallia magadiensis]SFH48960.1 DNA-binding transcriptional regulator, MurR/RpiR family, contains HTH and SIS domains [Tindallia magadiensis]
MDERNDLILNIQKQFPKLSKGQKRIAQFIIENYEKAAFMTASKLGMETSVSESTVVRFANNLGFEGYPQLQRALQDIIKTKLTTVQRVDMGKEYSTDLEIVERIMKSDMDNMRNTIDMINAAKIETVIDMILNAERIYVLGLRSSKSLADFLGFYLGLILGNVVLVGHGISDIYEQMLRISDKDLLIGLSFPRYSSRSIEVTRYAKEQGAKIVAITDSEISPIANMADEYLTAKSNMASFVDSLVAPLSLLNALIVAIGMREKSDIKEHFNKLETIWEKYKIYDGDY